MKRTFSIQFTFNTDQSGRIIGDWSTFYIVCTKEGRT